MISSTLQLGSNSGSQQLSFMQLKQSSQQFHHNYLIGRLNFFFVDWDSGCNKRSCILVWLNKCRTPLIWPSEMQTPCQCGIDLSCPAWIVLPIIPVYLPPEMWTLRFKVSHLYGSSLAIELSLLLSLYYLSWHLHNLNNAHP